MISVLITTYNRPALLGRAVRSVLDQDYKNVQLIVVDDVSDIPASEVLWDIDDPRLSIVRNEENVGSVDGDMAILRGFLHNARYGCRGEAFVYLCDDDYWIPRNLLSRQIAALNDHPRLAFVQGGMAQCYANPLGNITPNADYLTYEFPDEERRVVFGRGLFPKHVMSGKEYLRLFADDPKNRNINTGATLYRTETFLKVGALDRLDGVRWQGGYAMLAAVAVHGDVLYLDDPCLMTAVDKASASFRGTQRMHMMDALASIDVAFSPVMGDKDYRDIRNTMARSVLLAYVCNKIAHAFGWFNQNTLGNISAHFLPPIPGDEFLQVASDRGIPLTDNQTAVIKMTDGSMTRSWEQIVEMLA